MSTIKIYGASDDNVEVEGDVEGCDEYTLPSCDFAYIGFDDGTIVKIEYNSEGIWRVFVKQTGTATATLESAGSEEEDGYTDVLTLTGDISLATYYGHNGTLAYHMASLTPEQNAAMAAARRVIKALEGRKGFDHWWHDNDASDKAAIIEKIGEAISQ